MSAWKSPQSIFNLGHPAVKDLFSVPVQVQEKVDGSFFAFGVFAGQEPEICQCSYEAGHDTKMVPTGKLDANGLAEFWHTELRVRSKGAVMVTDAPQALFVPAVNAVKARQHLLKPGWQYRGETLVKPKHNALSYDRIPKDNIILFDVCTEEETYLPYEDLRNEAERLGFEVVPQIYAGTIGSAEELRKYLDTISILGGQKIEGVVVKPLSPLYGPDKKMLFGKFVSEAFKEVHRKTWGESNPGPKDIILRLGEQYASPARFQKALIHLQEAGEIEGSPRDIGKLIKAVPPDVLKECKEEIKEILFKYAWPHISRLIVRGVPTWYKELLLTQQFEMESRSEQDGNGG